VRRSHHQGHLARRPDHRFRRQHFLSAARLPTLPTNVFLQLAAGCHKNDYERPEFGILIVLI
jgi:hypothetical protein